MLRRSKKKEQQQQQQALHPQPHTAPPSFPRDREPSFQDGQEYSPPTSPVSPLYRSQFPPQQQQHGNARALGHHQLPHRGPIDRPASPYGPASAPTRLAQSSSSEIMPPPMTSPPMGPSRQTGLSPSSSASIASTSHHMGRSQSAFNFILSKASKAKNSLGAPSHGHAQQMVTGSDMPPSTSLGSMSSLHEDLAGCSTPAPALAAHSAHIVRGPQTLPHHHHQQAHAGPYGSHPLPQTTRSSSTDFRQMGGPSATEAEYAAHSTTSPTKKGFFSRDRKGTAAASSVVSGFQARGAQGGYTSRSGYSAQSGASSGRVIGSAAYGQFSKSQSDLHSRTPQFSSPGSMSVDLPKVPALPQSYQDERNSLRSPAMHNLSRSVEDLGLGAQQQQAQGYALPRSPSPQPVVGGSSVTHPNFHSSPHSAASAAPAGTWGEHGVPAPQGSWSRPSDIGTMKASTSVLHSRSRQSSNNSSGIARAISPSGSRADSIPFSSASGAAPWPSHRGPSPSPEPSNQPNHAGHQRKQSRFGATSDGFFSSGMSGGSNSGIMPTARERKATGSSLASSFSLGNVAAGASTVMDKLRGTQHPSGPERPPSVADSARDGSPASPTTLPLPPGALHQGFLNRNGNLSLTLSQLGGGRDKEKDVSKGWKPYRVILKDASLQFFKPPSNIAEEVKGLFPNGVVRVHVDDASPASSRFDAEMLKHSGLGTQALLRATSTDAGATCSSPVPTLPLSVGSVPVSPSKKQPLTPIPQGSAEAQIVLAQPQIFAWHQPGKHPDLVLAAARERPSHWAERIECGSLDALTHEIVMGSQTGDSDHSQDVDVLIQATLAASLFADHIVGDFITALATRAGVALANRGELSEKVATSIEGRLRRCLHILATFHSDAVGADGLDRLRLLSRDHHLDFSLDSIRIEPRTESQPFTPCNWLEQTASAPRPKLAGLSAGQLSGSHLLDLEPPLVAAQIQVFHADRLRSLAVPRPQLGLCLKRAGPVPGSSALLMSFSADRPHYLTRLILDQVLDSHEGDTKAAGSSGWTGPQARHRARLLRHWIAIASWSLSYGDVLGWTAIMAALCSRAISRLEHTWRLVAEGDRTLLGNSWALKLAKLNWNEHGNLPIHAAARIADITSRNPKAMAGRKPACIPYLGDSLSRMSSVYNRSSIGRSEMRSVLPVSSAASHVANFYQAYQYWASDGSRIEPDDIPYADEPAVEFQQLLQRLAASYESVEDDNASLSSYLQASLSCEPRSLGTVDLNWRPPLPAPLAAKAILPLIFPDAVSNLDLLDHREVIAKAASDDNSDFPSTANSRDPDATIRSTPQRYVRSPLGAAPLIRASLQSLTRTKGVTSPGARSASGAMLPFGKITEWGTHRLPDEEETLFRIGHDLVLKSSDDMPASLPSSPMTSKRFSQDFGSRNARPLSQVSKRSSLPASNRSSVVEPTIVTHVSVKTGTLERLVDVAVLGVTDLSITFGDEGNDSMPPQAVKKSRLTMDLSNYRLVFLTTFRSICSPLVFFEFLRKRYMAAVNGGREMNILPVHSNACRFPGWSLIDASAGASTEPVDWDFVARVRHGVIAVLRLWITRFTQDFVDDAHLYDAIFGFAKQQSLLAETVDSEVDTDFARAAASLQEAASLLRINALRVNAKSGPERVKASGSKVASNAEAPFNFDTASPIDLVDYLECVARVYFCKITERDWLAAAEVLDAQSAEPLGWHVARDRTRSEEPPVFSIYKLLELLKSPLSLDEGDVRTPGGATAYEKLPTAVRDAWGAQSLLRGWIAIHIIEQHIGVQLRQARIEKLLDAVWLSRARMLNARADDTFSTTWPSAEPFREATIGSFVENVIVSSLTAPESRTFVRAWQGACHARGGTGEGFEDLVPRKTSLPALNQAALGTATPDVSWVLRCLAQAVSRKSPTAQADSTFVDFSRCQLVFDLIESTLNMRRKTAPAEANDADLTATRLPRMQEKLRKVQWDSRAFRDDAAQEAATAPPLPRGTTWRAHKPLQAVIARQNDKLQRDRHAYDSLKTALDAAKVTATRSPMIVAHEPGAGRASTSSVPQFTNAGGLLGSGSTGGLVASSEKKSRRMTSLWRGATRFGGGGGGGGGGGVTGDKVNAMGDASPKSYQELLAATPTSQKPSLVISLAAADVKIWKNLQRSFTFHISSHDGQRVLLQASSPLEFADWLSQIDQAVREAPSRTSVNEGRRFGAGGPRGLKSSAPFTPFFGLDLPTLVEREGRPVPLALSRILAEIEARGLHEVGIYRISGSKVTIDALQQAFRSRPAETIDVQHGEFSDVHVLSNLVKLWLRELPEPVVPFAFYRPLIMVESIEDTDERLTLLREIIWRFPRAHFDLLKALCEHFARVVDEGEHNKMLTHNIGLIFGTSLLTPAPSPSAVAEGFGQLGQRANLVKLMVSYYDWIFDPAPEVPEPEADVDTALGADGGLDVDTGLQDTEEADVALAVDGQDASEPVDGAAFEEPEAHAPTAGLAVRSEHEQNDAREDGPVTPGTPAPEGTAEQPPDGEELETMQEPPTSATTTASTQPSHTRMNSAGPSVADASRAGQALRRPDLPKKDSRREELSIYADALDIDLDAASASAALRSSLLPDDAMLDIMRMIHASNDVEEVPTSAS
ncbi:unnamed protein product [Parajaminaea phylloscopi]